MNRKTLLTRYLLPLILLSFFTAPAFAQGADLKTCKKYRQKMDDYALLRKRGGTPSKMEKWRQKYNRYEKRFIQGKCTRWKRELWL